MDANVEMDLFFLFWTPVQEREKEYYITIIVLKRRCINSSQEVFYKERALTIVTGALYHQKVDELEP